MYRLRKGDGTLKDFFKALLAPEVAKWNIFLNYWYVWLLVIILLVLLTVWINVRR